MLARMFPIVVAIAAPAAPILKPEMKIGSSILRRIKKNVKKKCHIYIARFVILMKGRIIQEKSSCKI